MCSKALDDKFDGPELKVGPVKTTVKKSRLIEITSMPHYDLGDRVKYKVYNGSGVETVTATITRIEVSVAINDAGIRQETISYSLRWPVRELSNSAGYRSWVPETTLDEDNNYDTQ